MTGAGQHKTQSDDDLGVFQLHEMVHVLLYNRSLGAAAAWSTIQSKLNSKGPTSAQDTAELLVYLYLSAQEEIFAEDFVSATRKAQPSTVWGLFVGWRKLARQCFKLVNAQFTTLKHSINVSRKVGGARCR